MADAINDITLKLANYLFEQHGEFHSVSISGIITYLTLLLVNFGLMGPAKYHLLDFLNCNYSFLEISHSMYILNYKCIDYFTMDEFLKVGRVKTAFFHSMPPIENFQQTALQYFDVDLQSIDAKNKDSQLRTLNEWGKTLQDVPFSDIFIESYKKELSLLIINEYFLRFQWEMPFHPESTKKGKFKNINSRIVGVEMMRRVQFLRYYDDQELNASIAFIELLEKNVYAALVLPNEDDGVMDLLKRMNVILKFNTEPNNEEMVSWFCCQTNRCKITQIYNL
ncbi:Serpin H1 [Thelohanellus kitauei]|uniref:Serpin H1 n=1 Tax=Thelohanellus kitauei TaxID=669202 RepID=A0A0C2MQT3_THEKT|nr:Serpin H1 [Thelohanellus kitauei]